MVARRRALLPLLLVALLAGPAGTGRAEPPRDAVPMPGILRGATLLAPPYFHWKGKEDARHGLLGTLEGTTREFEQIVVEVGADRRALSAPARASLEAFRYRHDVERGEPVDVDVKPDAAVVRLKNPFRDGVHASAVKTVGRTVVYARGAAEKKKDEAALVAVLKAVVAGVTTEADEVDGWLPPEVKATWTRVPGPDFLLVHDGKVDAPRLEAIAKAVREGYGVVRKLLPGPAAAAYPPVVRVTANRDMFAYLSGRKDLRAADAVHLPWIGELLVSPREADIDASRVAAEAASQALQFALGAADAEPLRSGLMRQASVVGSGAPADALLPAEAEAATARVKAGEALTWYRLLMLPSLSAFLAEDAANRSMDAELSVHYLLAPSSAVGRAGLSAYAQAFKKWGHPDAASEAAVAAMDGGKADQEYAQYWKDRFEPPKKPGKPGAGGKPK